MAGLLAGLTGKRAGSQLHLSFPSKKEAIGNRGIGVVFEVVNTT